MIRIQVIVFALYLFLSNQTFAQVGFPTNGPEDKRPQRYAITDVNVYMSDASYLRHATILIEKNKIIDVGKHINIPSNYIVYKRSGFYVYPAFIDLFSHYGLDKTSLVPEKDHGMFSGKKGAFAWNDALHPERNAARDFHYQEKESERLQKCGISLVLSAHTDGICRGSTVLVSSNKCSAHQAILAENVSSALSFDKGESKMEYPNSMMGAIALLRQTYLDAQAFGKVSDEKNLGLQAFVSLQQLPAIFEVDNKLSVLRAQKIAQEFSKKYLIKGAGDEYQRLSEIKSSGVNLIIPMQFPKAIDIKNAWEYQQLNYKTAKHWELAPSNAALLNKENIPFSFTSYGCDPDDFWKNFRLAIRRGLPLSQAIEAFTRRPAQMIHVDSYVGEIKNGYLANLILFDKDVKDNEARLFEHWTNGKQNVIIHNLPVDIRGKYIASIQDTQTIRLIIFGEMNKPNFNCVLKNDTIKGKIEMDENTIHLSWANKKNGELNFIEWNKNFVSDTMIGWMHQSSNHALKKIIAISYAKQPLDSVSVTDTADSIQNNIVYPFVEYGWSQKPQAEDLLIHNARVWTNEKEGIIDSCDILIRNGKYVSIGKNIKADHVKIIDASGKQLSSGIIDEHSHIAIYKGVNECSQSVTAEVRIGDVLNSEDINIYRQLSGGVIAAQLLHGSCNPIGGQSALIKLRWGLAPEQLKISNADGFIKFALGENVKRSNSEDTWRYPQTRMGVEQTIADAFIRAYQYDEAKKTNPMLRKDLELETIAEIIHHKRFITCHSYVQSEINMLMNLADSLGFSINTFTHILEGYKVADKMKKRNINASTFADWWGYKFEVSEAIPFNAALMHEAGINVAINSDDAEMGRRLNQEAAKTIRYGNVSEEEALKMVTLNPAKMLHLDNRMGSIKVGKDADFVIWTDNPLSIYAEADMTFIDGICYYDRTKTQAIMQYYAHEKARIVSRMKKAVDSGAKSQKVEVEEEINYHCED